MDISPFIGLLVAAGVPTAFTGFCFWLIEKKIQKREYKNKIEIENRQRELEEKEKTREDLLMIVIESVNASITLSEATARAVQRIPDAKCNGDMHAALEYASKIKTEQKRFLNHQGIKSILE